MAVPIESFVYTGFSVEKAIGEVPKLNFEIVINTRSREDIPNISHVYINHLDCEVFLGSTDTSEPTPGYSEEGNFGTYIINVGKLIEIGKRDITHLVIPLNSPKVDKFLEIRHKKRYLLFDVDISGYCLCYDSENKLTEQIPLKRLSLKKKTARDELSDRVIFNTDDFVKLMKEIKGYRLESVEIPIYNFKEQQFPNMKKAVDLLKSAYQNLYSGKELETVRDIRNLFLNYLTFPKKIKTEEGKKSEKFLKNEIKNYIMSKVPENSKEVYEAVIKALEKDIRSICDILSKFIHETDDKLINVPLHKDLEFLYLSALSIVTYLAKQLEQP